jgi:hypothetical protein
VCSCPGERPELIALRRLIAGSFGAVETCWLATTGCTGGKWPFSVTTFYDNGTDSTFESSTPCKS